jgi:hypothetical protein
MKYLMAIVSIASATVALAENAEPHPILSSNGSWVPIMLIIIGGMFLAAAVIGPIVRANMPEEIPPPAHSHDEPPGASHHHGKSGTVSPAPEDEAHH